MAAEATRAERARVVAWLRREPQTVAECDGHCHQAGRPCCVLRQLTLDEAADAIERGAHEVEP